MAGSWRQVLANDPLHARPIISGLLQGPVTSTPLSFRKWRLNGSGSLIDLFSRDLTCGDGVPKLRQPPAWMAALWGAIVALCVGCLTAPVNTGVAEFSRLVAPFAALGAASGLMYAFASKRNRARAAEQK